MISYGDYYIRKKKFEEEGRNTYLAGDLNKFTSQTSEFMAFVDNYINQLTTDEQQDKTDQPSGEGGCV